MLRAVEPEDLDLLYKWENNPALWNAGNTRNPFSYFAIKQYIINAQRDIYENKQLRLMIEDKKTKSTVGTVDLFDFDLYNSRISLGLYTNPEFQGKGYAKQSLWLVEEYVFDFMQINQLNVFIAQTNTPSIRMFEKEKYHCSTLLKEWIRVGGKFVDVAVFQRFKKDYEIRKEVIS